MLVRLALATSLISSVAVAGPIPGKIPDPSSASIPAGPQTSAEASVSIGPSDNFAASGTEASKSRTRDLRAFRQMKARRVILVTIDTLRADHLGCYGYLRGTSPFIDRLAKNGWRFRNALSCSSHTAPSHASIFTSLYPVQHKVLLNGQVLQDPLTTMAEYFRDRGFSTAAFSGVGFLEGLGSGFQHFSSGTTDPADWKNYRPADKTVSEAIKWTDTEYDGGDLFLWIHLYDPHFPYGAPAVHRRRMSIRTPQEKSLLSYYLRHAHGVSSEYRTYAGNVIDIVPEYDAEVLFVDSEIRRLYQHLSNTNMQKNSLWIITSDHGEAFGEHKYYGHGKHIYQEQIHVPLIFHFASEWKRKSVEISSLVSTVDILPTLADLISPPREEEAQYWQGVSLTSVFDGKSQMSFREFSFAERRPKAKGPTDTADWELDPVYTLLNHRFKYIFHGHGKDEFFDLEKDPLERRNLVGNKLEDEERLRKKLEASYRRFVMVLPELQPTSVDKRHLEELKALGYIQ